MARTLNVREPQVLIHYPADNAGFYWHHRVLLRRLAAGRWVCLTPDHELVQHDLVAEEHIILDRNSAFPAAQAAHVYAHDEIGRAALEVFRRRAETMAALLGDAPAADAEAVEWAVAEANRADLGGVLDEDQLDSAILCSGKGLAFQWGGGVH